ncbi:MAG: AraC family transcriptional regulator [Nonlabens sp.]
MKLEYLNIKDGGRFIVTNFQCDQALRLLKEKELYKIIWCKEGFTKLIVDGCELDLYEGQLLFCTPVNVVDIPIDNDGLIACAFNREFYCIFNYDSEVSCMGMLYHGSTNVPSIKLTTKEKRSFEAIQTLLIEEFIIKDQIQGEMLRTLLKRILITATRIIKQNQFTGDVSVKQVELIRRYNLLVEQHFKEKHQVADYAELLVKSPKTLSHIFKRHGCPSPLKLINERIIAEAKRLLLYSNKSAEEIAFELGYSEPSHFSKFFKKHVGFSPLSFRKNKGKELC